MDESIETTGDGRGWPSSTNMNKYNPAGSICLGECEGGSR